MCCGMVFRVMQRGSRWRWEILSADHTVLACGEEGSSDRAGNRAVLELLTLHESFHQDAGQSSARRTIN